MTPRPARTADIPALWDPLIGDAAVTFNTAEKPESDRALPVTASSSGVSWTCT